MAEIEKKLEELGIELPIAPTPVANYVSTRRCGNLLFLSGAGPIRNGKPTVTGKLGGELTVEDGYKAARQTGLNLIAQIKRELGDLDRVKQFVKVQGYVASTPDFIKQPAVINGLSDVLVQVFGEKGKHTRTAVATPVLPFDTPVEADVIVEFE